ncbi:hypothetical protein Ancab_026714 [Ancistrocladus abbreviatus]
MINRDRGALDELQAISNGFRVKGIGSRKRLETTGACSLSIRTITNKIHAAATPAAARLAVANTATAAAAADSSRTSHNSPLQQSTRASPLVNGDPNEVEELGA